MESNTKLKLGLAAGGFALLVLLLMRNRDVSAAVADVPKDEQVLAPGGNAGFNSTINVGVNANSFNSLSRQYMPTFGMVGVGVVNSGPTAVKIEYNTTNLQAPSMPQYMVPGLPPVMAAQMAEKPRRIWG